MFRQPPELSPHAHERGYTILEVLVAIAIVSLAAFTGLAACKTLSRVVVASSSAQYGAHALEAQAAQLQNEAASAFAVFVPPSDRTGRPNAGQEVDFYTKADRGGAIFWCYYYDASTHTLQRWDYEPGGASGVRDNASGSIDSAAAYPALNGVTEFRASSIPVDGLGDPARNGYSGLRALFTRPPRAQSVHYGTAGGNDVVGGNGVVQIVLANTTAARRIHLAAGSMAAGFTVTGAPAWHAVVYRVDQSHRFLLGAASKSHVFINAHVDVSYDHWKTRITWCDFNLLGNPDGLDPHDPHADYKPQEPLEQSDAILAACRTRYPNPPLRDSAGNPPDADAVHQPLPGQTAPPCWTRPGPNGRCWPANAPVDWVPPSPLPIATPPPAWCAQHALSPVCAAVQTAARSGG